jgi:galactokinase
MAKKNVSQGHKGFKADFDDATMMAMEEGASSKERGQQRRLVLLACARDSETLVRLAKEEPKVFEEMGDLIIAYQDHAKAIFDVSRAALARIAMAYEMSKVA